MARFSLPALLTAALAAMALAAAPALAAGDPSATAAPAQSAADVSLGASLESCSTSGAAGRSAVFSATMPAAPKASRLVVRFDLFSRPDIGGLWKPVRGVATFGTWDSSAPGAGGLKVTKQVGGLRLGNSYRAVVRYRWVAASGKVVRTSIRATRACTQNDPRPDLTVAARAGASGIIVVVRNAGHAARAFEVKLSSGSRQLATEKVTGLAPGRARPIIFDKVECEAGSTVKVTVDAGSDLVERSELNNTAELRCPASS